MPPGFPMILVGLFSLARWMSTTETLCLQVFTLVMMGLTCILFYGLVYIAINERIALISAILWITYPLNLWLTKQPNSEIAFLPLLYGAWFLVGGMLWKGWNQPWVSLVAGVCIGSATLVRPNALGIGLLLAGILLAFRNILCFWIIV